MRCASFLFPLLFFPGTALFGLDWPNWRGPDYNGVTQESLPATLPEELSVLWKAEVGIGFSSFAVVGDRVLTMGNLDNEDIVWCLNAKTGEELWQHRYPCDLDPLYYEGGPGGTPTVTDGAVFTLSKKGHVFRLDLESGEVIWSRNLLEDHQVELPEWSFAASPFVVGDQVLLNVGRGGIALSKETGETLWLPSQETSGYATILPYPSDSRQEHLLFSAKSLISFDRSDGSVRWEFPWKSSRDVNAADPVLVGNRIVVSSSSGSKMLRPVAGTPELEVVWEQPDMKWYFNPGVLLDGYLYSLHGTTHRPTELMCVDVESGQIVWSEEGFGSGGLVATRDRVIVFDLGTLTILDAEPKGYKPLLRQKLLEGKCWTAPVLANGQIYCRSADGKVVAVSASD